GGVVRGAVPGLRPAVSLATLLSRIAHLPSHSRLPQRRLSAFIGGSRWGDAHHERGGVDLAGPLELRPALVETRLRKPGVEVENVRLRLAGGPGLLLRGGLGEGRCGLT